MQQAHAKLKAIGDVEYLKAAATRAKGDLVYIGMDSDGYVDISIADDALVHKVAVARKALAADDGAEYVKKGEVKITVPSGNYTAGHGLKILDGAIASTAAVYPAAAGVAGEAQIVFGSIKVGGTAVTEITAVLHGELFTATT